MTAEASAPRHGYLPDPAPLTSRAWWVYDVRYDHGAIAAGTPQLLCQEQPSSSARRMGRYAFELWIGAELIERIRFDFPLLAGEPPRTGPRRPLRETPSFAAGARVSTRILVPVSSRATRAQLLDRATGETIPVPWPPQLESAGGRSTDTAHGNVAGHSSASSAPCGNASSAPATPAAPAAPTPPAPPAD